MEPSKTCGRCQTAKPLSEFYANRARPDGVSGYCIPCQRESDDASEARKRAELLALLGGKCRKCGFDNPLALQVDHVNGGGGVERRSITAASHVLLRRVQEHPDWYQLLCANCNIIKRFTNGEHVGSRVYTRKIVTELRRPDPNHVPRRRSDALARAVEITRVCEERRPLEFRPERLPQGSWSRHYERCLYCRTTERRHAADGLCTACNARLKGYGRT